MLARNQSIRYSTFSKISAQPHTTLCIQFLDRENNDKNDTLPLGKQICFTIVWGCAEIFTQHSHKASLCTHMFTKNNQSIELLSCFENKAWVFPKTSYWSFIASVKENWSFFIPVLICDTKFSNGLNKLFHSEHLHVFAKYHKPSSGNRPQNWCLKASERQILNTGMGFQ